MVIGFDLWNTLIKSSVKFAETKKHIFEKHFEANPSELANSMASVKKELNTIIEKTGWQPSEQIIIEMLAYEFKSEQFAIENFLKDYRRAGCIYNPTIIYEAHTRKVLDDLQSDGHDLHIVSNTMFFDAETLRQILDEIYLSQYFTTMTFSDEVGASKPSESMLCIESGFDVFVGDNPMTDGVFAHRTGAEFIHINTNDTNIKHAYNIITKIR